MYRLILAIVVFVIAILVVVKKPAINSYEWEQDLHQRLLVDFNKTHDEVKEYIAQFIPEVTDSMMDVWEETGELEYMKFDGEKRYFRNAGPNLFRVNAACKARKDAVIPDTLAGQELVNQVHLPQVIKNCVEQGVTITEPKRMRVTYTLTVDADAVPASSLIRCWLPLPRKDVARQKDVKIISTSDYPYKLAPDTAAHNTLYMERRCKKGEPTVFSETFEYTSCAEWYNLRPEDVKPYDVESPVFKEYTAQRSFHMRFSDRLIHLAEKLVGNEKNPLLKARRIFRYVNDNYPWASAREYSTITNIPEYVLTNHKGDCGQVSLLFIALCRISGIPAHFQSGFMMHPGAWNLHDWAEVYFEGVGWVPVDMSFGIPRYAGHNKQLYWFFLGGIDSWRMVVNQDYGKPLYPEKVFPRSETVDFQRGEVEWEGGNIYFNHWDYHMDIEYLDE